MSKKSILIRALCVVLPVVMAVGGFAGCNRSKASPLNETSPLRFAIANAEGVFNPFFSTSATDSQILGITQVAMLSSDKEGNPTYGENEPTVVKDMKVTMKDKSGNVTAVGDKDGTTEYEFLLKNDMKFSDGHPLTMKDVLFNLYVYLDPVYTGSATLYSTDIQGLAAYRTQTPGAGESEESANEITFSNQASNRIADMIAFGRYLGKVNNYDAPKESDLPQLWADIDAFNELFKAELTSDYLNAMDSFSDYEEEYDFVHDYQLFYFMEGILVLQRDINGYYSRNEDGKYMMDVNSASSLTQETEAYAAANYMDYKTDEDGNVITEITDAQAKELAKQDYAISVVYDNYTIYEGLTEGLVTRAKAFAGSHDKTDPSIVYYTASYTDLHTAFKADQRSKYYESQMGEGGTLRVPSISGIDGSKTTASSQYGGKFNGKTYSKSHEVLKITINGVDPKAIWNFGFTVAPLHYYSDHAGEANNVDYFGVEYSSTAFMTSLKRGERISLPVGAGAYMASTERGITPGQEIKGNEFFRHNIVYYERNPYFETMGEGISNAKIKYMRYQVYNSDQIMSALGRNEIDFGDPNAKTTNVDAAKSDSKLNYAAIRTNGYGYVGLNPRYIPNIWERRAIIKAMDTAMIAANYYQGDLGETIYRPMSSTSWAYPKGAKTFYGTYYGADTYGTFLDYNFDSTGDEILTMLTDHEYTQRSGKLYNPDNEVLKYTFTIAGESEDHPAWAMFKRAEEILESIGFDITVKKDARALSKLVNGELSVWAAAWSSTIDPDMYQVYHKESQATSVNNWGYPQILNDQKGIYTTERTIIDKLSDVIEDGRKTTAQSARKPIYEKALDLIMELAVELPTYQRNDLTVYNKSRIKESTLTPVSDRTPLNGLTSRVWEIEFN